MSHILAIDISDPGTFEPAGKFKDIGSVVNLIVTNMFMVAGLILFIGIIIGGFMIMTQGSNPEQMHKGQQLLTYSLIGIALIFVSYFLVKVVLQILGIASFL